MSLFDASVDLNPHQIEAALFALRSPLSKGVIMADEVGLGKTIEAGLVLCQYWAEQRRRLLIICPASIRKQWSLELAEKFNLPSVILDARSYRDLQLNGNAEPFDLNSIVITSFHFAGRRKNEIRSTPWDLVVIDEAHRLRNAYRPSNKIGQAIRRAVEDRAKLLLTATPLQNSLLELYGLSSIISDHIFGEIGTFRSQYMSARGDLEDLRHRLRLFCKRTLRKQVAEYIQYTERRAITFPFNPSDDEQKLYDAISAFLMREGTYAIPGKQKQLTTLIMRKLLASSSHAVAGTLETMKERLENIKEGMGESDDFAERIIQLEEIEEDLIDEASSDEPTSESEETPAIDARKLDREIKELNQYVSWAKGIGIDTKSRTLLNALDVGFTEMQRTGASRKALIFTESRRTQEYVKRFLEANGYAGKILIFNGSNTGPEAKAIYDSWVERNLHSGRVTGSRQIDCRTALIEHFRDFGTIMIATEAAAEGVNLQFCSLVVNYDLPWNPQRIEQRIGRCHRYGQKHDVVVINFLNERNEADKRVLELLEQKFNLFSGVFGSSDEVLGTIESGVDFEKRILAIYQECRTPDEIEAGFKSLQDEMEETIRSKLDDTRRILIEHFDEDVHARLKVQLDDARQRLDRFGRFFWSLTKFVLDGSASFDDQQFCFELHEAPVDGFKPGVYRLISKDRENIPGDFLYRISHPLGEYVIEQAKGYQTPPAQISFDISNHPAKISVVESLKGQQGWLTLQRLIIESFQHEEYLLFSAFGDAGQSLDQETCEKLFHCSASWSELDGLPQKVQDHLREESERHVAATISRSLEENNRFFVEERERLEKWADDMILSSEKDLADTKNQIKDITRQARLATTVEEQHRLQEKIRDLEKKKRRQRQRIFDVEDEIVEKRDGLISALEKRMAQQISIEPLFTIRWRVE